MILSFQRRRVENKIPVIILFVSRLCYSFDGLLSKLKGFCCQNELQRWRWIREEVLFQTLPHFLSPIFVLAFSARKKIFNDSLISTGQCNILFILIKVVFSIGEEKSKEKFFDAVISLIALLPDDPTRNV